MTTHGYISYRNDYKYQLAASYHHQLTILPTIDIITPYIDLSSQGLLVVKQGYAWDGPSGPVKDTPQNMRASLVHDALYQLMRHDQLKSRTHRKAADQLFKDICQQDGVSSFIASVYYKGLRRFGKHSASPQHKKVVLRAPVS